MQEGTADRQLTVIAFTDLVGYSALTESDEALALELLDTHRGIVRALLARFGGVEIKTIGDAFLLEFSSAQNAVRCLVEVQDAHAAHNASAGEGRAIHMRAGVHLGDVERRGGDIFGSGVNIAARIEPVAPVDGIAISEVVHFQVRQAADIRFESVGKPELKNIGAEMEVFVWCRDPARIAALRAKIGAASGPVSGPLGFLSELRRRKVIQTLLLYVGAGWLLQQGAAWLVPQLQWPTWVLPAVAVALFAGFPVVMYLAWLYDITPQGVKRTGQAPAGKARFGVVPALGLIVIVLGSGALGMRMFTQLSRESAKGAEGVAELKLGQSIAVLPFKDQSPDQDQAFFAEGLAEELTSLLGHMQGLQVAASTSAFHLAERGLGPVEVGKQLKVASVLTGSVRVAGDRMKIRVELVNPADGKTLWTESFSRKLADVFDIEAEISRSIVNLLQDKYLEAGSVKSQANTASTDAYVLYLKGREQYRKQTTEGMEEARKLFEQAVGLDPEYALAYVGVADTAVLLAKGASRFGTMEPEIAARLAGERLAKALVRAPELAEAYAIQGKAFDIERNYDEVLPAYDKAISLNPNLAIAHMWRFRELDRQGRYKEAMEALERASQIDPVSIATMFNRAYELSRRGRFDESRAQFEALIQQFPESPMGHKGLADAAFQVGELALSLQHWKAAREISPEDENFLHSYVDLMLNYFGFVSEVRPLATGEYYKDALLLASGDVPGLYKELDYQVATHTDYATEDARLILFNSGWVRALTGERETSVAHLLQLYEATPAEDRAPPPDCWQGMEFAWALQRRERKDEAGALLDRCAGLVKTARAGEIVRTDFTYLAARIAALRGDKPTAVAELRAAVDAGWREWWTPSDPVLESLHEDPAGMAEFQRIETALATEREKARLVLAGAPAKP